MASAQPDTFQIEELLIAAVADLIGDVRHVAVGNASPIPAAAGGASAGSAGAKPAAKPAQKNPTKKK